MGDLPLRTPTHRRLGGPLPRQLANAPHAHPPPDLSPFPASGCPLAVYAVLVGISPGYPPVAGRLHTCYSPVRRSPAKVSKLTSPLPLDLHVLSLSLAFILSQDQTRRCCILSFFFFSCFEYAAPRLAPRQLARHSRSTQHRLSEPRRSRIASFYCVYFFSMTCLVLNSSS